MRTKEVTITVLVIYSWSLLQFAVVTTKTTDEYEAEADEDEIEEAPTTIFDLNHNEPVAIPEVRYANFLVPQTSSLLKHSL